MYDDMQVLYYSRDVLVMAGITQAQRYVMMHARPEICDDPLGEMLASLASNARSPNVAECTPLSRIASQPMLANLAVGFVKLVGVLLCLALVDRLGVISHQTH